MRIFVTGREGQVAQSLLERAKQSAGIEIVAVGRPGFDLTNAAGVKLAIKSASPDLIVSAAAYTAVDKAEGDAENAYTVNRDGAAAVAEAAEALGVPVIHLSTDYVYPGDKAGAYLESDSTGPASVYGASKLAGEHAVIEAASRAIILRTAWVYSPFGNNFVKTMLRIGKDRSVVRVVDDQIGNPTSALDIADAILAIAPKAIDDRKTAGTYNLAGTGAVSWCGLARHIFSASHKLGGPNPAVEAITTSEYPTPAKRPANSQLDCSKLTIRLGIVLPQWTESIAYCVSRLVLN